ncbi:hypothetical protein SARC_06990 [Sphaeroforma arctica JP610]|uniref:Cation efflux protein cytoplasmic domain-containing protein n=1 Tax=Sphaeroforma arctica JP610 TaxID=667725 RepID=A0A0L0FV02_9EUKA|nr:hypothetical protein SARC_06990 [Sphaeroforma arctica JP610]KNC80652.1 hypothetical protein SARC_06990 [Sphaeroforma arctica JP610]|eukprot:XP_014154554.1 hypothetical protein SARC_06990 [Sphaeroforma arctica JP610]
MSRSENTDSSVDIEALETQPLLSARRDSHGHSHSIASEIDLHKIHGDDRIGKKSVAAERSRAHAARKIYIATAVCFCFMVGEVVGGYFSGSLAIMTDAAHLLSDIAGFFISLVALHLAGKPASHKMSFGYNRAEIVGALLSVLLIWLLTGVLLFEAVSRLFNPIPLDGKTMFITACAGVFCNIVMATTLSHSHSHGLGGGDHGHSHGDAPEKGHGHAHGTSAQEEVEENINVKAAYIHVLGDLVQSIGVVIAAALVWHNPELVWVDPICTFLFSILVLATTFNLMRDALHVLMEGVPKGIDVNALKEELESLPGVVISHDLHVWSITIGQPALAVHLCLEPEVCTATVLLEAQHVICDNFGIHHSTVQLEQSNFDNHCVGMDDCNSICVGPRGSIMRGDMRKGIDSTTDLNKAKIKRGSKSKAKTNASQSGDSPPATKK